MNKSTLTAAVLLTLGAAGASFSAQAALTSADMLAFDPGVRTCNNVTKVYPNCGTAGSVVASGTWFSMDADGSGTVTDGEKTIFSPGLDGGVFIGVTQDTNGHASHSGAPHTGTGGIDTEWGFFNNAGMVYTSTAVTDLTGSGATRQLDFSGWTVTWNGIAAIPMGGDVTNFPGDTTTATIVCSSAACAQGDTFVLDYAAHVPLGDPSKFGGVPYAVHMTGTIAAAPTVIPVPAAVWLLGSGLVGLVGVARRKKAKA